MCNGALNVSTFLDWRRYRLGLLTNEAFVLAGHVETSAWSDEERCTGPSLMSGKR